jgi:hypothetical protein
MISIMTALQESGLRNLSRGDRDSLGLFQQRPSQGWGTPQQIMDPSYAASKFFTSLMAVADRDKLSLSAAAQKVQRSAYPNAYAKWEDEARDILSRTPQVAMAAAMGGGLTPPDSFASWLTPIQRQVNPNVLSSVGRGLSMIPGGQQIISGFRPGARVAGSGNVSLHASGRAADIGALARVRGGTAASEAEGDRIAALFRSGVIPGVSEVLWKTMTGGDHFNHVHVGFRHKGGFDMPQMRVGGTVQYDDTIANLHKNETVLTAPLSAKLNDGINNMASGGDKYEVSIDLRGAVVKDEFDFKRAVLEVLEEKNEKLGRKRKIGG